MEFGISKAKIAKLLYLYKKRNEDVDTATIPRMSAKNNKNKPKK